MSLDTATLAADGRIVLPAGARRELGLKPGDVLAIESDGTSLLIRSYDAVIQETQAHVRPFVALGEGTVDEVIADRRAISAGG